MRRGRRTAPPDLPPGLAQWVRSLVSPGRWRHILGVVDEARRLARLNGLPGRKAALAAYLHDAAKEMPPDAMLSLLEGTPFRLDRHERKITALWHPHASAALAFKAWGVRDKAVLEAVRRHALGGPDMGPLARVLFVADYVEPGRRFKGAREARLRSRRSLSDGVRLKCEGTMAYLRRRRLSIHPRLKRTWQKSLT